MSALQPIWNLLLEHLGVDGIASPAFLLTAVVAGIYVPGIFFSFLDVVVTKRQTLAECWAVYWRAMKWYGSLYVVGMIFFVLVPFAMIEVPAQAPTVFEF